MGALRRKRSSVRSAGRACAAEPSFFEGGSRLREVPLLTAVAGAAAREWTWGQVWVQARGKEESVRRERHRERPASASSRQSKSLLVFEGEVRLHGERIVGTGEAAKRRCFGKRFAKAACQEARCVTKAREAGQRSRTWC